MATSSIVTMIRSSLDWRSQLEAAAQARGESMTAYIKRAVDAQVAQDLAHRPSHQALK